MVAVTGIGSGLDIEGLVTSLVNAERAPAENRLVQREARLTSEISAFGSLRGALAGLQSSIDTLTRLGTFNQRSTSSSDAAAVSASASSAAAPASYSVAVDQLAQAQSLASASFASPDDSVGEGTLTFRFGTTDYTPAEDPTPASYDGFTVNAQRASFSVTIDGSNNSLEGVRDAINAADAGVLAAIVNDGSGYRLLLSSEETGAANSIEIQVDDGDLTDTDDSGLSRLAFNASADNLEQTVAGRDAQFSINGLSLSSADNVVSEVIEGVDLTLRDTTSSPATVTVSENTGAVRSAIESLVTSYNAFVNVANGLTAYNAETGVAGPLQGDFTARSVINQVRSALTATADGFDGPFSTLAELGITTASNGTLSIDSDTLNTALSDNFDAVAGVFAQVGSIADSGITFESATASTRNGSYAVNITQLATRGSFTGASIVDPAITPVTIGPGNDSLTVTVDGVASGSILLTHGTYASATELVAELQSRINGDSALANAGISVVVAFTAGNEIRLTSDRFGSQSVVTIDSVEGSGLGLSAGTGTTGLDVAGSIGGVTATGDGQRLSAAAGSAADGVRLTVTGGALGPRGTLAISSGVGVSLSGLLDNFLDGDGLLSLRSDGLQGSVERIADEREALDRRLASLEERYRLQFNALDSLLANIQSTGDFLTQQLANIPIPGQGTDN